MTFEIIRIDKNPEYKATAAVWFHEKWDNPIEMYNESIDESMIPDSVLPKWYLVIADDEIIGGAGVIGEASVPDLCAVYVEKKYRRQGIAGKLLQFICEDMAQNGVDTLYLITEFDSFYEKYGWEFMTVIDDMRLYRHKQKGNK